MIHPRAVNVTGVPQQRQLVGGTQEGFRLKYLEVVEWGDRGGRETDYTITISNECGWLISRKVKRLSSPVGFLEPSTENQLANR